MAERKDREVATVGKQKEAVRKMEVSLIGSEGMPVGVQLVGRKRFGDPEEFFLALALPKQLRTEAPPGSRRGHEVLPLTASQVLKVYARADLDLEHFVKEQGDPGELANPQLK